MIAFADMTSANVGGVIASAHDRTKAVGAPGAVLGDLQCLMSELTITLAHLSTKTAEPFRGYEIAERKKQCY